MIVCSEATQNAFKSDGIKKYFKVKFPNIGLEFDNSSIVQNSFSVKESLMSGSNLSFYGCISSTCEIELVGVPDGLKGQKMVVSIQPEGLQEINVFTGFVDSAKKQEYRKIIKIVAYDALYNVGDIDVANWYKSLSFPISLEDFRNSLFEYIHIDQYLMTTPVNDGIVIDKLYEPNELSALDVIKSICQINGVCGIIDRDGFFAYRYWDSTIYDTINDYKSINYEDYAVNPVSQVLIRNDDKDSGTSFGSGNRYVVQGNIFAYNLKEVEYEPTNPDLEPIYDLHKVAENILSNVGNQIYIPYRITMRGLPYFEVGDRIKVKLPNIEESASVTGDNTLTLMIVSRTLSGGQTLTDTFEAEGEENQRIFISDLGIKLDLIGGSDTEELKKEIEKNSDDIKDLQSKKYLEVVSFDASTGILRTKST